MKKLLLIITIIIFTLGGSLAIAQEQETKTLEVLQLELQVLQNQAQSKVHEINKYVAQGDFLRLAIPAAQVQLQELSAQIRKKVSEIKKVEEPKEEPKPKAPDAE